MLGRQRFLVVDQAHIERFDLLRLVQGINIDEVSSGRGICPPASSASSLLSAQNTCALSLTWITAQGSGCGS